MIYRWANPRYNNIWTEYDTETGKIRSWANSQWADSGNDFSFFCSLYYDWTMTSSANTSTPTQDVIHRWEDPADPSNYTEFNETQSTCTWSFKGLDGKQCIVGSYPTTLNLFAINEMHDTWNKVLPKPGSISINPFVVDYEVLCKRAGSNMKNLQDKTCNHKWLCYTGLNESFEFCELCDLKRGK